MVVEYLPPNGPRRPDHPLRQKGVAIFIGGLRKNPYAKPSPPAQPAPAPPPASSDEKPDDEPPKQP